MKSHKRDGSKKRDHISNLPDDIISNILSRLPTKYAVQTCVLSKVWGYKWTSIYNIDVSEGSSFRQDGPWLTFVNFVDRILFYSHNVRRFVFRSYSYSLNGEVENRMKTWLSTVFRRNVEEVTIDAPYSINLPRSFLTCSSLRELDMKMPCTWKTPVNSYFPNLTELRLWEVVIMHENSNSDTLIFHFPVLKTFEIREYNWLNVSFVELRAPALISFLSENVFGENIDSYVIKIIGASLQNFYTHGRYLENCLLTGSTVSYAALNNDNDVDDTIVKSGLRIRRFLTESSSLKSLELTYYLAQALAETKSGLPLFRFDKLERLALSHGEGGYDGGNNEGIFEGLFELLRSAPVLKSLTIVMFYVAYDSDMMEPVPSCAVSHLEEVEFYCCLGEIHELHLAMFFLENGAQLKEFSLNVVV